MRRFGRENGPERSRVVTGPLSAAPAGTSCRPQARQGSPLLPTSTGRFVRSDRDAV
jgi:hypothetical protein